MSAQKELDPCSKSTELWVHRKVSSLPCASCCSPSPRWGNYIKYCITAFNGIFNIIFYIGFMLFNPNGFGLSSSPQCYLGLHSTFTWYWTYSRSPRATLGKKITSFSTLLRYRKYLLKLPNICACPKNFPKSMWNMCPVFRSIMLSLWRSQIPRT